MDTVTSSAARCLARLLVAQMRLLDPERVAQGVRDGTLRTLMATEVMKAWKDYKAAVPQGVLEQTDYFREALNDILAGGETVFT
jgi:hypothetical protein